MKPRTFATHNKVTIVRPDNRRFWHPKIELWPIQKLRRSKRNARTHSKKQREKLLAIIRRFGFINPIIIDENGNVIAGHLRLEVAGLHGHDARARHSDHAPDGPGEAGSGACREPHCS